MEKVTLGCQGGAQTCPKSVILFTVQMLLICVIVISSVIVIASIMNISLNDNNMEMWIVLLSSSIGYVLPYPKLKQVKTNTSVEDEIEQ